MLVKILFGTVVFLTTFGMRTSLAQQNFKEGIVVYAVTLHPKEEQQEGAAAISGSYTIKLKGKYVRKDLQMENGFTSTTIIDGEREQQHALKLIQGNKFAIQIDAETAEEKRRPYLGWTQEERPTGKEIAGLPVKKLIVHYKNGTSAILEYTTELVPQQDLFERFPGLLGLPLAFEAETKNGMKIHFLATKVLQQPVENISFRIPADYKIITGSEYREMLDD